MVRLFRWFRVGGTEARRGEKGLAGVAAWVNPSGWHPNPLHFATPIRRVTGLSPVACHCGQVTTRCI